MNTKLNLCTASFVLAMATSLYADALVDSFETTPLISGSAANPPYTSVGQSSAWSSDGANSLAVDTGGVAIRNENNFVKALDEIDRDTSSYYVLGYRPANAELDGKFREITVRVKRQGVSVRSRKGYLATRGPAEPEGPVGQVGQAGQEGRVGTDKAATPPPATDKAVAVPPGAGKPPAVPSPAAPAVVPTTPAVPIAPQGAVAGDAARSEKPPALRLRPDLPAEVAKLAGSEGRPDVAEGASQPLPDSLVRQAKAGWEAYQRGDVKGARIRLAGVAAHPGARPWMRYVLGWSEYALTEYEAAATEWEQVRQAVPEFEPVYFDLVDTYLQQGEYGRAVGVLRAAEKRWSQDLDVYNALGVVQLGRGAIDDAIKTFEKGVAVDPTDPTASYNLAKTHELRYVRAQRLQQAARSAANTLSQDRDLAIEYYRRTVALGGPFVESAKEGLKRLRAQ